MRRALGLGASLVGLGLVAGCVSSPESDGAPAGPSVAVSVAALNLDGVADVVWDVEVVNGRTSPAPDVVWQRRLSSSRYGDGAGSASYVGPCDADPTVSENTVKVWVVGVYSAPVSALGSFASGAAGGVDGVSLDFQNPTTLAAPLTRTVACQPNADAEVQFDVALMRPAQQGFFDISVNFNNIFCSAKFDCCTENAEGTACASDIALLFEAGGARGPTMVLGFACTAGPNTGVETELYLDPLELDCTSPSASSFGANLTLNPAGAPGNRCTAGANGMGGCTGVVVESGVDADTYLYQLAVYRGFEDLTSGGVDAQKVYWNVALGVKRPAIGGCWLKTQGTADDANTTSLVNNGVIAAGAVYPYVQWEVNLGTCRAESLSFGDSAAMVRTEYTQSGATGTGTVFAFGFGPHLDAGSFCAAPCVNGTCVGGTCQCTPGSSGETCNIQSAACTGLPANAAWNTVSSISQTWDGSAWLPTTAGVYSATASTTSCVFDCAATYTWNGSACVPDTVTIVSNGSVRNWSDGTYAANCDAYRHPTAPRTYAGATGNGEYTISPAGTPFNAYCDMTADNGGWTLVFRLAEINYTHDNADNVPPTPTKTKAKFASSVINQISGQVAGGGYQYEIRLDGPYTSTLMKASEPFYVSMNTTQVTIGYDCDRDGVYEGSRTWNSWYTDRGANEGSSWIRDWVYPQAGQCNAWNGGNVMQWWAGNSTTPGTTGSGYDAPITTTPTGYSHSGSVWVWVR